MAAPHAGLLGTTRKANETVGELAGVALHCELCISRAQHDPAGSAGGGTVLAETATTELAAHERGAGVAHDFVAVLALQIVLFWVSEWGVAREGVRGGLHSNSNSNSPDPSHHSCDKKKTHTDRRP